MPFSNWLHHVAIRGCVIGALVVGSAGSLLNAQDNPQEQPQASAPNNDQQQASPPSPVPVIVTEPIRIEREKTVDPNWRKPECGQPQNHDEADLCEQRRMAEAAENTVKLSAWQLGLGVVGAFLLFVTLYYSRQAARGAIVAAEAAQASVGLASTTAERQLRAYVSVTPRTLQNFKRQWRIGFECVVKNHGQTPCSELNYVFGTAVLPSLPPVIFPEADRTIAKNAALFPDKDYFVTFFHDADLSAEDVADVETGAKRLHVWGVAHYRDAFGQMRTTEFSASVGGPQFAASVQAALDGKPPIEFRWEWGEHHSRGT